MSLTMYEIAVPSMLRGFGVLSSYLDKAAAFAQEVRFPPTQLLEGERFRRCHIGCLLTSSSLDAAVEYQARVAAIERCHITHIDDGALPASAGPPTAEPADPTSR